MKFNAYADQNKTMGISMLSCGHIFAPKGRSIKRLNGRNSWLLLYIAQGCETFYLNTKIDALPGSFILYKPFERQVHLNMGEKTAELYYVHFTLDDNLLLNDITSSVYELKSSMIYSIKPSTTVCNLFEEIINEVQIKQPCYESLCVYKLLELICLLKRRLINFQTSHKEYRNKIEYIIQLMNLEYGVERSLEEYAAIFHCSKYHFIKIFEEITGSTPIAYRNHIRMEHAKELLEYTSVTVNEIAENVGFKSSSYFCDSFKRLTGLSPSQYRRNKWS